MMESLILELHELITVLHVVLFALPIDFNFSSDLGQRLGVLKILLFQIFFALLHFPNIWG